ncbi:MAG: hypothetical protein SA339_04485 [Methanomassiliicoccus sp.]|nr:hypothetical protein [Methanomassiliicoccus sp.]
MLPQGQRPPAVAIAAILLVCSLSPLVLVSGPAEARLSGAEPLNGNQELIANPSLPYIYYGGNSQITAYNYQTGARTSEGLSGASSYVDSMDLSADGTKLAVACGATIYILTLTAGVPTSSSAISSQSGNVKSLCFGADGGIYVTYESSSYIDTYNPSSGYVAGLGVDTGLANTCILRTNEARTVLLAATMGSAADTVIISYSLAGGSTAIPSKTGQLGSVTGKLAQFEATNDRIYLACTNAAGIQVVSLSTMALETVFSMPSYPSGVALSRDDSVIYGISTGGTYPAGQSVIYAFDHSGNQLSRKYVSYETGPIVPTADSWVVGTAAPLTLETIGPEIEANSPAADAVYAYSPAYVRFNITHDPVIEASSITATVDGTVYPVLRMSSDVYQINLTSALSPGTHAVEVDVPWGGTTVPATWTFVSGSAEATALRPMLNLVEPAAGSSSTVSPDRIVLEMTAASPPPYKANATVTVNDLALSAVAGPDDPSRFVATIPSGLDLVGDNTVTARVSTDGLEVNDSWTFTVVDDTASGWAGGTVDYGDNFSMPSPADWTVQRDSRGWELTITGPSYNSVSTTVLVDIAHDTSVRANQAYIDTYAQTVLSDTIKGGEPAEMVGDVNHTAISYLTAGVWKIRLTAQGIQEAYALIVDEVNGNRWLIKCSASDTNFIDLWPTFEHVISGVKIKADNITPVVAPPGTQGYAYYRMLGDYQLMVPDNWTLKREAVIGDTTASLKLTGPRVGELHVTILLENGTDPSLRDDPAYLPSLVPNKFLPGLKARGIEASVYEGARILSISDHTAMVFSITWTDPQNNITMIQEVYYIVDGPSHRYWMFTCETPEGAYQSYAPIFDRVAQSFSPLSRAGAPSAESGPISETVLVFAVLGIIAAATIILVVAKRYRPRI